MKPITCPDCGRQFTPWRGKRFCSERCRKRSENKRVRGGLNGLPATTLPEGEKSQNLNEENQLLERAVRGDEACVWTAVNEVSTLGVG